MLTAHPYRGIMYCTIWECQIGYCQMGTWDNRKQLQIRSPALIHLLTKTLMVFRLNWQSLSGMPKESQKDRHWPESYRVPGCSKQYSCFAISALCTRNQRIIFQHWSTRELWGARETRQTQGERHKGLFLSISLTLDCCNGLKGAGLYGAGRPDSALQWITPPLYNALALSIHI